MLCRAATWLFLLSWLPSGVLSRLQNIQSLSRNTSNHGFYTTNFAAPSIEKTVLGNGCQDEGHFVFLTPKSAKSARNQAVILDSDGNLVWYQEELGAVSNFHIQNYQGQDHLVYWVGDDEFSGHGRGYYKIFDQSYNLAYVVDGYKSASGDYNDFSITSDGHALITSYVSVPWNLRSYNRTNGFIWDCVFQEIDVKSQQLLFEWRASSHFQFRDMVVDSWRPWTGTEADPWDWFHLNSVEKDTKGNYLIGARYPNAITYINGTTGDVIWNLGGKLNNFSDLSWGNASKFIDPHMARWSGDLEDEITVFDNQAYWTIESKIKESRGVHISLDIDLMIARQSKEFVHPGKVFAQSDGSLQTLRNGNAFIGYGSEPVWAEFSANGTLLCSSRYSQGNALYRDEQLTSYRVYKHAWAALPETLPLVYLSETSMYVSWNGATELYAWELFSSEGKIWESDQSKHIGVFPKTGFETALALDGLLSRSYHLTALDSNNEVLGGWIVNGDGVIMEAMVHMQSYRPTTLLSTPWILLIIGNILVLLAIKRRSLPWIEMSQISQSFYRRG